MHQKAAEPLALARRVHGDRPQKQNALPADLHRPVADDGGQRAGVVAQRQAKGSDSRHAIAQAVGGQRGAAGRETEVVKRLDLPPVIFCLFLKPVHACAFLTCRLLPNPLAQNHWKRAVTWRSLTINL